MGVSKMDEENYFSKENVTAKRFEARNVYDAIGRLLDTEKFEQFLKHVKLHREADDDEWIDLCNVAKIPEDMRDWMQRVLFDYSIYGVKDAYNQGFCWLP